MVECRNPENPEPLRMRFRVFWAFRVSVPDHLNAGYAVRTTR
jgi:hypothetical protein